MMYGAGAYGEFAYSEHIYEPLDSSAFLAFLADPDETRCWLLEIDGLSRTGVGVHGSSYSDHAYSELSYAEGVDSGAGGLVTHRFASQGYISGIDASGLPYYYDGRLVVDTLRVERAIAGSRGVGGLARVFFEAQLVNDDGGLDTLPDDYAFHGRTARLLIGRPTDPRSAFGVVATGVVQSLQVGARLFTWRLSDGIAKLRVPVSPNVYAGTGDLEGGADLAGKPKPQGWGSSPNITPPLVDKVRLIYQVRDGEIQDVPAVYDRQVALVQGADYGSEADLLASAPAAGQYRVWKEGGYFRLGATPDGNVTCDAELDASGAGYVERTGDIVLRILSIANLYSTEIDPTSFERLNDIAPAPVEIWIGPEERRLCDDVIDELLAGIGAFGGFSRQGAFSVGLVRSAEGVTEAATYDDVDIVSVTREALPAALDPVVFRVGVGYQRNYTPQVDVAASVTDDRRSFAAQVYRVASREDLAVRDVWVTAREIFVPAHYQEEADADEEALRQLDLWSRGRKLFAPEIEILALVRELGEAVRLEYVRHGLAAGRSGTVLGYDLRGRRVTLKVLV